MSFSLVVGLVIFGVMFVFLWADEKGTKKKKKRQEQVVEYIELARDKIEPAREAIGEMTEIL